MIRSAAAGLLFLLVLVSSAFAQSCSVPNTLTNGTNADANQVMANFNALLACVNSASNQVQQAGRLTYANSTQVNFGPLNGNQIKINGALSAIPAGGIAGCSNASVYVNGTASQNLAASTLYYVYAFVNSGAVTCDFSTTTHATSTTAGNAGTEIESGNDTRSLIGMAYTSASSTFVNIQTVSWFNRQSKTNNISGSTTGTPTPFIFVTWANEAVHVDLMCWSSNNASAYNNSAINIDGAPVGQNGTADTSAGTISRVNQSISWTNTVTEGSHTSGPAITSGSGTATMYYQYYVTIRG